MKQENEYILESGFLSLYFKSLKDAFCELL